MTGESMSSSTAGHASLAEGFASFGAYASWTATTPQSVAASFDVARFHAYTGEVTFLTHPGFRVYFDGGVVYHAERNGDPSIGESLLAAGVVDTVQLKRGMVRVGDIEHLGRLFERDPSIDRDAVMVTLEGATEIVVQQLTNSAASTVTVNVFRHHPSGIHRWFVPQSGVPAASRPSSGATQIDRSVVEDLPVLGVQRPAMVIEWTEPDLVGDGLDSQPAFASFDADRADWVAVPFEPEPEPAPQANVVGGEFRITWPDGTYDDSIVPPMTVLAPQPVPPADVESTSQPTPEPPVAPSTASSAEPGFTAPSSVMPPPVPPAAASIVPPTAPPAVQTPPIGEVLLAAPAFDTPPLLAPESPAVDPAPAAAEIAPVVDVPSATVEPLRIDRIPLPDAAVPDDVAAAVRRALQAIEDASSRSTVPERRPFNRLAELKIPSLMDAAPAPTSAEPAAAPSSVVPEAEVAPGDTGDTTPAAIPTVTPTATPADVFLDTEIPIVDLFDGSKVSDDPVVAAPAPTPSLGFPPPTNDMRAEAVYERAAAQAQAELDVVDTASLSDPQAADGDRDDGNDGNDGKGDGNGDDDGNVAPYEPGKASVVFLDDQQADPGERRSALRRLIGSLRKKED